MNFEINLAFLIKLFFLHDQKFTTKIQISWESLINIAQKVLFLPVSLFKVDLTCLWKKNLKEKKILFTGIWFVNMVRAAFSYRI